MQKGRCLHRFHSGTPPTTESEAEQVGPALPAGLVAVLRRHLQLPKGGRGSERGGDGQGVARAGLHSRGARPGATPLDEPRAARAWWLDRSMLEVPLSIVFLAKEGFSMSLWGSRWMHVGSWWEVLLAAPGAAAWVLKVRWRGGLVKKGRVWASRTGAAPTGSQGHDGIVVLVDPGAQ